MPTFKATVTTTAGDTTFRVEGEDEDEAKTHALKRATLHAPGDDPYVNEMEEL
jgi:translation initiation factor IF-1